METWGLFTFRKSFLFLEHFSWSNYEEIGFACASVGTRSFTQLSRQAFCVVKPYEQRYYKTLVAWFQSLEHELT